MSIKAELLALVDQIENLGPHVRDTGEVTYFAARHQVGAVLEMAEAELSPPTEPTEAMTTAGINAFANLPADTTAAGVIDAVLRAALQAGQEG
ncbi:hypothetical protein [Cupriavidus necator]|uniref:hypothetical protein n=1 Tax=Cupriavidus necator TaxID=106590 RepID=UPI00339D6042